MNLILVFTTLPLGGGACYSNTTNLTTGNFGEWKTEPTGVNSACNNASKDYYLNININGIDQTPRKRLVVWNSLRKNIDEISNGSIELDIIKVKTGFKDLNKAIWQAKLDYARELANASLIAQQNIALQLINTTNQSINIGESTEFRMLKLRQAGEQAKTLLNSEFELAQAKITEAKKLSLLNGETQADIEAITAEANLHATALNITAQQQTIIIEQKVNNSITEVINSDDGKRIAVKDASENLNLSAGNLTTTGTGFFSFLGSLANRVTKLFVKEIDVSDNATIEALIIRRYDAFGPVVLLNNTADAIRIVAAPNITDPLNGAGIQLFGNTEGFFPGDVFIDAGSTSGGQIVIRTGSTGLNNRMIIEDDGRVRILNLTGSGNDYVCVDANGYLFRSNTAC